MNHECDNQNNHVQANFFQLAQFIILLTYVDFSYPMKILHYKVPCILIVYSCILISILLYTHVNSLVHYVVVVVVFCLFVYFLLFLQLHYFKQGKNEEFVRLLEASHRSVAETY